MASQAFSAPGFTFDLEEKSEETIVHCKGKLTADSAELFQTEIRDRVIPVSRGKGVAVTGRIVLDLSEVTYVDSMGLGALVAVWTSGQRRACDVEIVNMNARVGELFSMTKLDQLFSKMKGVFGAK